MNWVFPSNNGGDVNGISNAGIETFQGTRLKSLAREICQNSLDAAVDANVPVLVEFKSFSLETDELPDVVTLHDAFKRSKTFWECQSSKKAVDFFNEALKMFESGVIPCLRISDFNTAGLQGSHAEYNSPWCNLTKSSGASDKAGSAGGSFGIGKFAPFACSKFRTVFYSTYDKDGVSAYQGISRITSFKLDTEEITTGVGYYGNTGNKPVYEQFSLDPSYSRPQGETGTDIFVAGFKSEDDWSSDIVASIIDGFLYAIYSNKLIVKVDNITISRDTLSSVIEDYKEFFTENADKYYEIITSVKEPIVHDFNNMGIVKLWLDIRPEMHRKIAMVRQTGMKIMDRGSISANIPFAGLLYIEGDGINNFLRNLENPQHTKWEPDRYPNRHYAQNIIRQLIDFIKGELDKLRQNDDTFEIDPSVGEFLPDEAEDEATKSEAMEEAVTDTIKGIEKRVSPAVTVKNGTLTEGDTKRLIDDENGTEISEDAVSGAGHNDGKTGGNDGGHGDGTGSGTGPNPGETKKKWINVGFTKVRTVCLNKENGEYSIVFVPSASASEGCLKLYLSAESQDYEAKVIKAMAIGQKSIAAEDNIIKNIEFTEGTPVKLRVTIDYHDYCSMEVAAYGYKI